MFDDQLRDMEPGVILSSVARYLEVAMRKAEHLRQKEIECRVWGKGREEINGIIDKITE